MKHLKYFPLGIMLLSIYSYGADAPSEISEASASISACYHYSEPVDCLAQVSDKEEAKYKSAYSSLVKSLIDLGNANQERLAQELKQGKISWESTLQHDCEARGLLYDDGSSAYSDNFSNCLATQYAHRVDFYNGFGIAAQQKYLDKILQDYNKTHPKK